MDLEEKLEYPDPPILIDILMQQYIYALYIHVVTNWKGSIHYLAGSVT